MMHNVFFLLTLKFVQEHEEALKMMKEAADSAKKHAHDLAEELQRTREDAEREADDLRKKNMEQKMAGKQEQLQMQASRLRLQQELEECRGNVSHLETLNQTLEREKVPVNVGQCCLLEDSSGFAIGGCGGG